MNVMENLQTTGDNRSPMFSVIVPIYNTAEYIEVCIRSLLDQKQSDFEIIAIDDGSTDNSAELLE